VGRVGSRRVSHAALLAFIALTSTHAAVAWMGHETIWSFAVLQCVTMFAFGLMGPNFGAMSMEPLGHVAGTASSVQGFVTTVGGATLGFGIGALLLVLFAERGRLFRPSQGRS
jgi:DHA1 family bicyclomycin/chloramphenicol resistance-like MFS transporter